MDQKIVRNSPLSSSEALLSVLLEAKIESAPNGPVRRVMIPRGRIFLHESEVAECAWYIESGEVRVFRHSREGGLMVLAQRHQGDLVGELAMVDGGPRAGSAIALKDVSAIRIPRSTFGIWMLTEVVFARAVAGQLSQRLRETSQRAFAIAVVPVAARLAAELLRLAQPGAGDGQSFIPNAPTVTDMAAVVNATREAVSKILSKWSTSNVVIRQDKDLIINNPLVLSELLDR
jgi:CRP/FNR family transcriptional regulator, cyclic AMP receptor protein